MTWVNCVRLVAVVIVWAWLVAALLGRVAGEVIIWVGLCYYTIVEMDRGDRP